MVEYIKENERLNFLLENVKPFNKLQIEKILMDKSIEVSKDFFIRTFSSVHPAIWVTAALERFKNNEVKKIILENVSVKFMKIYFYIFNELGLIEDAKVTLEDIEQWSNIIDPRDWMMNLLAYLKKGNKYVLKEYKGNNIVYKYIKKSFEEFFDAEYEWIKLTSEIYDRYPEEEALFIIKSLIKVFDKCEIDVPEHWIKEYK